MVSNDMLCSIPECFVECFCLGWHILEEKHAPFLVVKTKATIINKKVAPLETREFKVIHKDI